MTAFLLTWNREKWAWSDLQQSIENVRRDGFSLERWSCGVTKRIALGDRVFLMKLGDEPRGIVGAGTVVTEPFEAEHWDAVKRASGKFALYIRAKFDVILDPDSEIFQFGRLSDPAFAGMHWAPQASGTTIPDIVAANLEDAWRSFVAQLGLTS
jgi:5-methylcytosine-specific restriction protein A